jgi:hypothetical protein
VLTALAALLALTPAGCRTGNGSGPPSPAATTPAASMSAGTSAAAGTVSGQVVFRISGDAHPGIMSYGTTARGPDAVNDWHQFQMPFSAQMAYVAPPDGPILYSLFASFDSQGATTCSIAFEGHTYSSPATSGYNLSDQNAKQVCEVIVGYTGGLGWHT